MLERGREYLNSPTKRGLDIIVAGVATVVIAPVIGCLATAKYLEDGENPFYVQERIGKNGEKIKIVKIRSMKNGDESDDVRVTKLGVWLRKTHLDELPQFYLALTGNMSIVGTRPIREKELYSIQEKLTSKRYEAVLQDYKDLKSGITGIWQIIGSGHENNHKTYHPNRFYLENANLFLDLKIIYKTAQKVFNSLNS